MPSEVTPIAVMGDTISKWMPSQPHSLAPTLVFICGAVSGEEAVSLQDNVLRRLGSNTPPEAVHWAQISPKSLEKGQAALEETVEAFIRPCLTQKYVEGLWEGGFLREMPSREQPLNLQVVVLYRLERDSAAEATRLLQGLETALQKSVLARAKATLVLIVVGEQPLDLGKETLYWPRFRIGSATLGQLEVSPRRAMEVCQNLLTALITSELLRAVDYCVESDRKSVGWMWCGASTLTVDLKTMREFVRLSVLRDLIKPMLVTELTATVRSLVEQETQGKLEELQASLLDLALKIASRLGWDAKAQEHKTTITRMVLQSEAKLRAKLFKSASNLSGILSDQFKPGVLSEHYKDLRDVLTRELVAKVNEEYAKLCKYFEFLMETPPEIAMTATKDKALSEASLFPASTEPSRGEKVVQDTLLLEKPKYHGLAATACAVKKAEDYLKRSSDAEYPGLRSWQIGSDAFLNGVGDKDEQALCMADLRYRRFHRTILSPPGFALKLLPAWPLLTALFSVFARWEEWFAAIVSGLLLVGVAIIEYFGLQSSLRRLRQRLVNDIEQRLTGSALGVLTQVLRDYRLRMVARLGESARTLNDLYELLGHEYSRNCEQVELREGRLSWFDASGTSVYWLADLAQCREWVSYAINDAQIKRLEFRDVVATEILPKRQPAFYRHVFDEQVSQAESLTAKNFTDSRLLPFDLAESQPPLQAGRRWEWLYQKAQPLGGSTNVKEFAIIGVETDAAVFGAAGDQSRYWRKDFLVARSRSVHEIACIRIVAECV